MSDNARWAEMNAWEDLDKWVEFAAKVITDEITLEYRKGSSPKPLTYNVKVRKHIPVHKAGDEAQKVALRVKKLVKTNPDSFLNRVILDGYKSRRQKNTSMPLKVKWLKKFTCFLYFISVIHKSGKEEVVYVGKTTDLIKRFGDGHNATQRLNDPVWNDCLEKRIYLATVELDTDLVFGIPLEAIKPEKLVDSILSYLESVFILFFQETKYNRRDRVLKIAFKTSQN